MTRTILTLAMLAAALAVAGCGGSSSSPGVAHLGSSISSSADPSGGGSSSPESESSASAQQKMIAFSHCMRTHGVPEFPEPSEGHVLIHSSDHNGHVTGVNPQSAQFQAASKACAKLSPKGGKPPSPAEQAKSQEKALQFSQCMRTHGVPSFPDPEFSARRRRHTNRGREGRPEPDRSLLTQIPSRAESVPVDHARAEGRPRERGSGPVIAEVSGFRTWART